MEGPNNETSSIKNHCKTVPTQHIAAWSLYKKYLPDSGGFGEN
jgi:hypothetical protein